MTNETWYVLDDGSLGDPLLISPGPDGRLTHKDGRKVAYAAHGPRSRGGVDAEAERAKPTKQAARQAPASRGREMKPDDAGPTYKTR